MGRVRRAALFAGEVAPGAKSASLAEEITKNCPERDDIRLLIDRLDMDDYVSIGGKA